MQTTMKTTKRTLERLKDHGKMGESFEKVVNRLLDDIEGYENEPVEE